MICRVNSQQHLENEANVTLRKNINLGYFLTFTRCYIFDGVTFVRKFFWCLFYNLQSAVCSLQSANVIHCSVLLKIMFAAITSKTCYIPTISRKKEGTVNSLLSVQCDGLSNKIDRWNSGTVITALKLVYIFVCIFQLFWMITPDTTSHGTGLQLMN